MGESYSSGSLDTFFYFPSLISVDLPNTPLFLSHLP